MKKMHSSESVSMLSLSIVVSSKTFLISEHLGLCSGWSTIFLMMDVKPGNWNILLGKDASWRCISALFTAFWIHLFLSFFGVNSSMTIMPAESMSTDFFISPSCTSRAKHIGVIYLVSFVSLVDIFPQVPKSPIFIIPSCRKRMLPGFQSLKKRYLP